MQEVVLPSLWPRKKNTRGPPEEEEGGVEKVRDVKEEARREVEEERGGREAEGDRGLRWRGRTEGEYEVPGAMPGMMVA